MTTIAVETAAVSSYFVVVALLCGSFINLAADRLPRGESIVRPRSHCRACGRHLNAVDLIPVAGFLLRRGRCASCGAAIGMSSLAVEALCGLAMATSIAILGVVPGALAGAVVVAMLGLGAIRLAYVRGVR